eukprot:11704547-Alexandrium_andersonii.AAC.1
MMGAIFAAYADGPVRLALDASVVVRRLQAVLGGTLDLDRRPWGLRKDGDLGQIFHRVLLQRQANTFAVCKVKGHADAAMVESGA